MMYESPIKAVHDLMARQIQYDFDNGIMKAIARYNIDVDKEELIKALKYDRDQYKKGYEDAKKDFTENMARIVEQLEEAKNHCCVGSYEDYDPYEDGRFETYEEVITLLKGVQNE